MQVIASPSSQYLDLLCSIMGRRVIIAASHASGPVTQKHQSEAVATPTDKRGFVTSESQAGAGAPCDRLTSCGRGGPIRKDGRTASDVFLTPRPPDALKNADGGFINIPEGMTVTRTTSSKGKTARTQATPKIIVKRDPALPFISSTYGPRGGWLGTNLFDPPSGPIYSAGQQYGLDAAKAFITALRADKVQCVSINFHGVCAAVVREAESTNEARRGAAHAFLDAMAETFKFSAKHGSWGAYFERKSEENARWVEIERKRESNRIQRSIEARRAKAEARKAANAEGGAA
jgi:hypothetical protein